MCHLAGIYDNNTAPPHVASSVLISGMNHSRDLPMVSIAGHWFRRTSVRRPRSRVTSSILLFGSGDSTTEGSRSISQVMVIPLLGEFSCLLDSPVGRILSGHTPLEGLVLRYPLVSLHKILLLLPRSVMSLCSPPCQESDVHRTSPVCHGSLPAALSCVASIGKPIQTFTGLSRVFDPPPCRDAGAVLCGHYPDHVLTYSSLHPSSPTTCRCHVSVSIDCEREVCLFLSFVCWQVVENHHPL
jgi:hypothetical protein